MDFGLEEHYSIISSGVSDALFTATFVADQYEASQDSIILGLFVIYKVHNNIKSPTFSANSTDFLTKPALKISSQRGFTWCDFLLEHNFKKTVKDEISTVCA